MPSELPEVGVHLGQVARGRTRYGRLSAGRGKQECCCVRGVKGPGSAQARGRDKAEKPAQAEEGEARGGPVPRGGGRCCQGGRGRLTEWLRAEEQRTSGRGRWEWALDQWEEGLWETQGGCHPKLSGQGRLGNKDLKNGAGGVS